MMTGSANHVGKDAASGTECLELDGYIVPESTADWGWLIILVAGALIALGGAGLGPLWIVGVLVLIAGIVVWFVQGTQSGKEEVWVFIEHSGTVNIERMSREVRSYACKDISKINVLGPTRDTSVLIHMFMNDGRHYMAFSGTQTRQEMVEVFKRMGVPSLFDKDTRVETNPGRSKRVL